MLAAGTTACLLSTDLDGLAGSRAQTHEGAGDDGGVDVADPPSIVPTDARSSDGDSDACAAPAFCDDFERPLNTQGNWDLSELYPASASLLLDSTVSLSPVRSLSVKVPGAAAGDRRARLVHKLPQGTLAATASMSYRPDLTSSSGAQILSVDTENPGGGVFIFANATTFGMTELNGDTRTAVDHSLGPAAAIGTWDHVELQLWRTSAGTVPTVLVIRNGITLYNSAATVTLGSATQVSAGVVYASPKPETLHLWVDDVRVTSQ